MFESSSSSYVEVYPAVEDDAGGGICFGRFATFPRPSASRARFLAGRTGLGSSRSRLRSPNQGFLDRRIGFSIPRLIAVSVGEEFFLDVDFQVSQVTINTFFLFFIVS